MLRALRCFALVVGGALAFMPIARAADLHVPSQYLTIQGAIAAAAPGDRVLVHPGTYHEALDFFGKTIEVIGIGGAAVTIVDATGKNTSVVTFRQSEPPGTLLQGFTLTGGTGQSAGGYIAGGGIFSGYPACPTIRACVITDNNASSPGAGGPSSIDRGGGLFLGPGPSPLFVPTVVDCVVSDNQASGYGGGIYASSIGSTGRPVVRNCSISGNQAEYGGGAAGPADFIDCVIEGNIAGLRGGGGYQVHSLKGSLLRGNTAVFGGGYYDFQIYGVVLTDCTLIENSAQSGGGAYLASDTSFPLFGPEALVSGCVFARNSAASGDGVRISFTSYVTSYTTIVNCSFDANRFSGGGLIEVGNCIIRNLPSPFTPTASYSNIEGGAVGSGNIDADPRWVDPAGGDYRLQGCSPCLDTGNPLSPADPDGTTADMGGLPFAAWTDLDGGVPGVSGDAQLAGTGLLEPGSTASLSLTNAAPSTPVWLVLGLSTSALPFKGGTFWPTLDGVVTGHLTDAAGSLQLDAAWPVLIGCGFTFYVQAWWPDVAAEAGWAGSNGLRAASR